MPLLPCRLTDWRWDFWLARTVSYKEFAELELCFKPKAVAPGDKRTLPEIYVTGFKTLEDLIVLSRIIEFQPDCRGQNSPAYCN